ncbi:MAG: DNA polymerase III subunit beta, partial [Nitrospirae bacterium]|nr:DNA polymerase III subunit beta [Nitrospirota bacterium]
MKIKISKNELLKSLSDIQGIIEKKTTMPILSHFLMDVKHVGCTLYATDLGTGIKKPVQMLEIIEEGAFCVSATRLYDIVREVQEDLTIEYVDQEWIKIMSGRANYRIAALNPDDYPLWPTIEDEKSIKISSPALLSMIEKTINCTGENDPRYALNGVLLHLQGDLKRITMVGTDGHRLSSVSKEIDLDFADEIKIIIPRKAAIELKKQLMEIDQELILNISKNHIKLNLGDREFLAKLIEGTYPNYDQVIPKNNDKLIYLDRENFMGIIRRVGVMSKEKSHAVRIDIQDGLLNIFANDPEIGEANDVMDIEYSG